MSWFYTIGLSEYGISLQGTFHRHKVMFFQGMRFSFEFDGCGYATFIRGNIKVTLTEKP